MKEEGKERERSAKEGREKENSHTREHCFVCNVTFENSDQQHSKYGRMIT